MKRLSIVLVLAVMIFAACCGAAFLATHPTCQLCGRRYGPLIPHPYRHPTTKPIAGAAKKLSNQQAMQRARATAPIINSLPPLTDANKNLVLSAKLLVGRWESQDGSRSPLVFRLDGTCDVGFIKQQGVWLIAKGAYEIQENRVVTRTQHQNMQLQRQFSFARGVLYAPKGPSPRVVWKRIGNLPQQNANEADENSKTDDDAT